MCIKHDPNFYIRPGFHCHHQQGVLRPGDANRDIQQTRGTKNSTVGYCVKFQLWEKIETQRTGLWKKYLILLFLHLKEQTNSGKCKNIVHKYIKRISVLHSYIFLNRFVLRDEGISKSGIC